MEMYDDLQRYLDHLCDALGHQDRNTGLKDYCQGLMLPIERKSVEPLAAHTDPLHVQAKHQSLHHFVAKSEWLDSAVLELVRTWVETALKLEDGCYWIIDDTGHLKQGKHSVGVAHQYCGQPVQRGSFRASCLPTPHMATKRLSGTASPTWGCSTPEGFDR